MRTIAGQNLVRDTNTTEFPDGQIQNKTETVSGTPVVRQIYGDILTNIYKFVRRNGVVPNEQEDGETNGYQLLEALTKNHNVLNDLMILLTVNGNNLTSSLNLDNLPNNYIFVGRVSEAITAQNYTLGSSGSDSFTTASRQSAKANGLVMVWLNGNNTVLISLEENVDNSTLNTSFGTPLSFNQTEDLYYLSNGTVFNNTPVSYNIQNLIRVHQSNTTLNVIDAIIHKEKLIALCIDTSNSNYSMYCFALSDLGTVQSLITIPVSNSSNNTPYMYCDGNFIYFTNSTTQINNSTNDISLGKFTFNATAFTLTAVSNALLNSNFQKTTNAFFGNNSELYTMVNGNLYRYSISGANRVFVGFFNTLNGFVFRLNNEAFYTNGNTAIKWSY